MADGTETLDFPGISIESGTGIIAAGTGLTTQPGTINIIVPGSVVQVLLYWEGRMSTAVPGDETIKVSGNGISETITGLLIGGPSSAPDMSANSAFRADITDMALVVPGSNTISVEGLGFTRANNGAGIMVIYDDGSKTAEIDIRDGVDYTYINSIEPRKSTIPQTFNFAPGASDRTATLTMFFSSVSGTTSGAVDRPTSIEITVNQETTLFSNLLDSLDGEEWDTLTMPVIIPAGASSLTVQAFSRDDLDTGKLPASFNWICAGLSVEPLNPCIDIEKQVSTNKVSTNKGITWLDSDIVEDAPTTNNEALYRLMIINCGDVELMNVIIADEDLFIDENIGNLAVGETITFTMNDPGFENLEQLNRCDNLDPPAKLNEAIVTAVGNNRQLTEEDPAWVLCISTTTIPISTTTTIAISTTTTTPVLNTTTTSILTTTTVAQTTSSTVVPSAEVTLIKQDGYFQPPVTEGQVATIKNKVCLENPEDLVGSIQFDICDTPDCLRCLDCELTERTVMFDCVVFELPDGCCRVIMFCKNPSCAINPGVCDIATVVMQTNDPLPEGCTECISEDFANIVAGDLDGFPLTGAGIAGELCPRVCGDICPPCEDADENDMCDTPNTCGDGVIDIYDIMCGVDFALTAQTPSDCAAERGDVPTGTPPWCAEPDGNIDILDIMVLIDMALNKQDCCSFYYLGLIY